MPLLALAATRGAPAMVAPRCALRTACTLGPHSVAPPPRRRLAPLPPRTRSRIGDRGREDFIWRLTAAAALQAPEDEEEEGAPLMSTSLSASSSAAPPSDTAASPPSPSLPGVKIDLSLPRRSRLVTFTCNKCDTRTERMVNPRAWESGMVFVQCGAPDCAAWHKIADAAGLVEEIRFDAAPAPLATAGSAALEFEAPAAPRALVVKGEEVVGLVPVEEGEMKEG